MAEKRLLERKKKRKKELERKRILIVCEDTTGGLYYFLDMIKAFGLKKIVEAKHCPWGNDPGNIVKYAKENIEGLEKSYCVFDKNGHLNYRDAIDQCRRSKGRIIAINSVPCFEYWVLLHFKDTRECFTKASSKQSWSDVLERRIKDHWSEFYKNINGLFDKTRHRLEDAIKNAKKNAAESERDSCDNPSTKIHELVLDLKKLRDESISS